jgi:disulfide bond formation protein DsbB
MTEESCGICRYTAPRRAALTLLIVAVATIAGAFAFEAAGYLPCELCLKERIPYYAAAPLALLVYFAAERGRRWLVRAGLWIIAALFLYDAGLSAYHSGVEWKIFAGPDDCSGPMLGPSTAEEFMRQLQRVKVVRCDEPSLYVLGLTLANWNVFVSVLLAAFASVVAWRRA